MLYAAVSIFLRGTAAFTLLIPFIAFVMVYAAVMVSKAFAVLPALMLGADAAVTPIPFFESGIKLYASIFGN